MLYLMVSFLLKYKIWKNFEKFYKFIFWSFYVVLGHVWGTVLPNWCVLCVSLVCHWIELVFLSRKTPRPGGRAGRRRLGPRTYKTTQKVKKTRFCKFYPKVVILSFSRREWFQYRFFDDSLSIGVVFRKNNFLKIFRPKKTQKDSRKKLGAKPL